MEPALPSRSPATPRQIQPSSIACAFIDYIIGDSKLQKEQHEANERSADVLVRSKRRTVGKPLNFEDDCAWLRCCGRGRPHSVRWQTLIRPDTGQLMAHAQAITLLVPVPRLKFLSE